MSSFSLPSASGVVSLLNDSNYRPELVERNSSGSSSIQSPISTYGGNSSSDTGRESLGSTLTSVANSSTDGSDGSRLGEIHALRKQLQGHNVHGKTTTPGKREKEGQEAARGGDGLPFKRQKSDEASTSPQHPSQSHSSKQNQSEMSENGSILHQERLAASPRPIDSSGKSSDESEGQVPLNMHKATSMSEPDSANVSTDVDTGGQSPTTAGKRRYPCSHPGCNKTFSTSGHAARHNRIHTGSKPYRCTFPGCNASFSRQDNSLQHYRTHVLHPKARLNGPNSAGTANSSSSQDPNSPGDDTDASVRMGRKALEEGTAIAVVREVVDGSGRKGEAVQRMVGQPKGSRQGSTSSSRTMHRDSRDHLYSSEYARGTNDGPGGEMDEDNAINGSTWSNPGYRGSSPVNATEARRSSNQHNFPPGPYGEYGNPPATYPSHPYGDSNGSWSQPSSMSYPPPTAVSSSRSSISGPYLAGSGSTYRPYLTAHGTLPHYQTHERPMSASAPSNGTYRSFDGSTPSSYAYQGAITRGALPGYPSNRPATDSSSLPLALPATFDHRRSRSHGVVGHQRMMPLMSHGPPANSEGGFGGMSSTSVSPPTTMSDTVAGRRDRSLSLLSNNQEGDYVGAPLVSHGGQPSVKSTKRPSPSSPRGSMRSRPSAKELQLPLPSISKLPYSSDRSTSTLTPTTPLDEAVSLRPFGRYASKPGQMYPGPLEDDRRILPPLQSAGQGHSSSL